MNKISLQFYDHVYVSYNDCQLFLYDTINNQRFFFSIDKSKYTTTYNVLVIRSNNDPELLKLVDTVSQKNLGLLRSYNEDNSYFTYTDFSTRVEELEAYVKPSSDSRFIVENYLNEITIHLDSYFEPFTLNYLGGCKKNNVELLKSFFKKSNLKSLNRVKLVTTYDSASLASDYIISLADKTEVELIVPLHEAAKVKLLRKNISNNLTGIYDKSIIDKQKIDSASIDKLLYIINDNDDVSFLEENGLLEDDRVIVRFSLKNDLFFLNQHLCYTIDDIFENPITINQIMKNLLINELHWGKITIDADGNVLSSLQTAIGNINNLSQIDYTLLFESTSLWKAVRKSHVDCQSCHFNCLCPPITLIESALNQTFCLPKSK